MDRERERERERESERYKDTRCSLALFSDRRAPYRSTSVTTPPPPPPSTRGCRSSWGSRCFWLFCSVSFNYVFFLFSARSLSFFLFARSSLFPLSLSLLCLIFPFPPHGGVLLSAILLPLALFLSCRRCAAVDSSALPSFLSFLPMLFV